MYGWYIIIVNAMEICAKTMSDGGWGQGGGPHMGARPPAPRPPSPIIVALISIAFTISIYHPYIIYIFDRSV